MKVYARPGAAEPFTGGATALLEGLRGASSVSNRHRSSLGELTALETNPNTVAQYMAAWNEVDPMVRDSILEQCWADDGVYVDPGVELAGREALSRHIAKVQAGRPGARLEFVSGPDQHHNMLRFLWRLVRADGTVGDTSIDFGEIGPDGRLVKVVGFFGPSPQIA